MCCAGKPPPLGLPSPTPSRPIAVGLLCDDKNIVCVCGCKQTMLGGTKPHPQRGVVPKQCAPCYPPQCPQQGHSKGGDTEVPGDAMPPIAQTTKNPQLMCLPQGTNEQSLHVHDSNHLNLVVASACSFFSVRGNQRPFFALNKGVT